MNLSTIRANHPMVEFLVRLSLQQYRGLPAPEKYVKEAKQIARIIKRVLRVEANVEDTAEATLRIYAIISQIPNEEVPPEDWQDVDVDEEQEEEYMDPDEMM